MKRRRRGKQLRGCAGICRETKFSMAGRVLTTQTHPWECPTKYMMLVAMRCNIDVQDLRRVLPPALWMCGADKVEPADRLCGANVYPQRVIDFSIGEQPAWGWFTHLNTSARKRYTVMPCTDWHSIFVGLGSNEQQFMSEGDDCDVDELSGQHAARPHVAFQTATTRGTTSTLTPPK